MWSAAGEHCKRSLEADQGRIAPLQAPRRRSHGGADIERANRRTSELDTVGVVEVRDQRAYVGAGGAFDLVSRPYRGTRLSRVAPQPLEAIDRDHALGHLELLSPTRPSVGALAPDLHRRVSRRALADLSGRQLGW